MSHRLKPELQRHKQVTRDEGDARADKPTPRRLATAKLAEVDAMAMFDRCPARKPAPVPRRTLPQRTRARDGRCDAHQGQFCTIMQLSAYSCITANSDESHFDVRTCGDALKKKSTSVKFRNCARMRTQVISEQAEAATAGR